MYSKRWFFSELWFPRSSVRLFCHFELCSGASLPSRVNLSSCLLLNRQPRLNTTLHCALWNIDRNYCSMLMKSNVGVKEGNSNTIFCIYLLCRARTSRELWLFVFDVMDVCNMPTTFLLFFFFSVAFIWSQVPMAFIRVGFYAGISLEYIIIVCNNIISND